MYITEVYRRTLYLIGSFLLCFMTGVYHGEFMRQICLEPWVNNWERETRQYFHPNEVWMGYRKVSALIAFILIFPTIGLHMIVFMANRLTKHELRRLQIYWIASVISFGITLHILLTSEVIGTLRDLSHFDEDVEIVYVPNLNSYVNNWLALRFSCLLTSQLPLRWIYQRTKRYGEHSIEGQNQGSWVKLKDRILFVRNFLFPARISSLRIYDDILLGILWVLTLRGVYLSILYLTLLRRNYLI
jgi:hypothetical protein